MARRTIYWMKQDANGKKHYYIHAERQCFEVEKDALQDAINSNKQVQFHYTG